MVEVKVLGWLQINGHVVLYCQVKHVTKVAQGFLPSLWELVNHPKVWNIIVTFLSSIECEDTSEINASLKLLIELLRAA
jgi:hypothetical protein